MLEVRVRLRRAAETSVATPLASVMFEVRVVRVVTVAGEPPDLRGLGSEAETFAANAKSAIERAAVAFLNPLVILVILQNQLTDESDAGFCVNDPFTPSLDLKFKSKINAVLNVAADRPPDFTDRNGCVSPRFAMSPRVFLVRSALPGQDLKAPKGRGSGNPGREPRDTHTDNEKSPEGAQPRRRMSKRADLPEFRGELRPFRGSRSRTLRSKPGPAHHVPLRSMLSIRRALHTLNEPCQSLQKFEFKYHNQAAFLLLNCH